MRGGKGKKLPGKKYEERCKAGEEKLFSQEVEGRRRESDWLYGNIEPQSIYVRSKLILIFGKRIQ